jgi:hypothetical protein
MSLSVKDRRRIVDKYTSNATVTVDPAVLEQIIDDIVAATGEAPTGKIRSPFAAPWLDSFLAHWALGENVDLTPVSAGLSEDTVAVLRNLVDIKFRERLAELQRFVQGQQLAESEPGTPDGPRSAFLAESEPGTPDGPRSAFLAESEPGTPDGPRSAFLADNPWILYWFISLRAPMLLDVIDVHLTRLLEEMSAGTR